MVVLQLIGIDKIYTRALVTITTHILSWNALTNCTATSSPTLCTFLRPQSIALNNNFLFPILLVHS